MAAARLSVRFVAGCQVGLGHARVRYRSTSSHILNAPNKSTASATVQEEDKVDSKLREFVDYILRSPDNRHSSEPGTCAVTAIETTHLAANSPCEDKYSVAHCAETGMWLMGVFDGHAGLACSQHVARTLFDYICEAAPHKHLSPGKPHIKTIFTNADQRLTNEQVTTHQDNLHRFHSGLSDLEVKKATVMMRLQSAFQQLDEDMTLAATSKKASRSDVATVASGSCACVAHVRGKHLYVANLGDSQAILASIANDTGGWTARRLSRSHHIENPSEVKRIRDAHPLKEYDTVLRGGRLLGQLYPLRAFGDVSYKWTAEQLLEHLGPHYGPNCVPPNLHTPPYLTATPEVLYHRLTPNDRFLIIASDGLWDFMSPDSVVRLLSDHMFGKRTLGPYIPPPNATVEKVLQDLAGRRAVDQRSKPLDDNGATHILRHAIGGSGAISNQYLKLFASINMPADVARDHRDDITITVMYFDPEYMAYSADVEDE